MGDYVFYNGYFFMLGSFAQIAYYNNSFTFIIDKLKEFDRLPE